MTYDVQYAVLSKVRAAGVAGDVTLCVSSADALRVLDGTGIINSDFSRPEAIDTYEGTRDGEGILSWKLDRQLPKGVARIERAAGTPTLISLADIIP